MAEMSRALSRIITDAKKLDTTGRRKPHKKSVRFSDTVSVCSERPTRSRSDARSYTRSASSSDERTPQTYADHITPRETKVRFNEIVTVVTNKGSLDPEYFKISYVKMNENGSFKKDDKFGRFTRPNFFCNM